MSTHRGNVAPEQTLGQIMSRNGLSAQPFESIGLHPEDRTGMTVRQICIEKGWNEREMMDWLSMEIRRAQSRRSPGEHGESSGEKLLRLAGSECPALLKRLENERERLELQIHASRFSCRCTSNLTETDYEEMTRLITKTGDYFWYLRERFLPSLQKFANEGPEVSYGLSRHLEKGNDILERDHRWLQDFRREYPVRADADESTVVCTSCKTCLNRVKRYLDHLDDFVSILEEELMPALKEKQSSL